MLYSRSHLSVRHAASTDTGRFNLNGVRFNADGSTEATNGQIFCKATPAQAPVDEFPAGWGATLEGEQEPFTFPLDAVNKLVKAIPKKSHIPILQNAAVDVPHTNTSGSARFVTTDLESNKVVEAKTLEGEWPNTAQVIPDGVATVKIGLNLTLLGKIEKALREFNGGGNAVCCVEIFDKNTAIKITAENCDGGEFLAVIMPHTLK